FEVLRRGEREHAAVPEEAAARDERLGACAVGLLAEAGDLAGTALERRAALDVAEPRLRRGRHDAERREVTPARELERGGRVLAEHFGPGDCVIGGKDEQQRVRAVLACRQRSHRNGRRGVASDRLEDHGRGLHADLAELVGGEKPLLVVAYYDRRLAAGDGTH